MRTFLIALATVTALSGCSLYGGSEGERKGKLGGNVDAGSLHPCPDGPPDGGGWYPDAGYGQDGGSYFGSDGGYPYPPDAGSDGGTDPCGSWHPDGGSWHPDGGWEPDAGVIDGGSAPDAP